jgi:large subunit ribosomal protein L24
MATATPQAKPTTRIKMRVKKGDTVQVISGKDKGKTGEVLRTLPTENRVIVQGINLRTRHVKPTQEGETGRIVTEEASLHASNVMLYSTDKKVASAARNIRLAYQPLTGQWRLNVASGAAPVADLVAANAPSQTFGSLAEALATLKQFSRWRIAGLNDNDPGAKYRVEFRFWLDTNQLPRPFQIGVIAQSEWTISTSLRAALTPEKTVER